MKSVKYVHRVLSGGNPLNIMGFTSFTRAILVELGKPRFVLRTIFVHFGFWHLQYKHFIDFFFNFINLACD